MLLVILWTLPCLALMVPDNNDMSGATLTPCHQLKKLEALPGYGWDNLQNKERRPVLHQTYTECRSTLDGHYALPDGAFDQPVHSSNVEVVSELIEHWSNYTDVTARSMSISSSLYIDSVTFGSGSIGGSFTDGYRSTKRQQYDDKTVTTRTQARYVQYSVGTLADWHLDKGFEARLHAIVRHLEGGSSNETIRLLAQLLIRDYGTHVVTRVDVGGVISKEDMISEQFLNSSSVTERSKLIRLAASYSFFEFFGANIDFSWSSSEVQSIYTGYVQSRSASTVHAYGGAFYRTEQCSGGSTGNNASNCLTRWVDSVPNNLVTVDRDGDPLFFTIRPNTLRNVSSGTLRRLADEIANAIRDYYNQNTHRGCLDTSSAAFEYYANMDDNTCSNASFNYTLGGVYRTCEEGTTYPDAGNLCSSPYRWLKNPTTGGYSCPLGHTAVELRRNPDSHVGCHEECSGMWFWKNCWDVCGMSSATYVTHWCAALGGAASSGVFFGGIYTSTVDNVLTGTKSCPPTFEPFAMLDDLNICLGVDTEYAVRYAVSFGGFFSCNHGNPLYSQLKKLGVGLRVGNGHVVGEDQSAQACPTGFSQHMAVIDHECYVYYCVKANSFGTHGDIELQLPPFVAYDKIFETDALQPLEAGGKFPSPAPKGMSAGAAAGITITSVAVFVIIALITVYAIKFYRARRHRAEDSENPPATNPNADEAHRGLLDNEEDAEA